MKNPVDFVKEACSNKRPYLIKPDDQFSAFLLQKGVSMVDEQNAEFLAETSNIFYRGMDSQMFLDFVKMVVPKSKGYHKWIKKDKEPAVKTVNHAQKLANLLKKSVSEMEEWLEIDNNIYFLYFEN